MNKLRVTLSGLVILALGGCSSGWLSGYQPTMLQGNAVSATQLKQLKTGMTKSKVRFLLGTPLLTDTFDPNRWDYTYSVTPSYSPQKITHLTLYFVNDKLVRIVTSSPS